MDKFAAYPQLDCEFLLDMEANMNITTKPLTPELSANYFDFFENRAFTDDSPYRCYCQMYQMTKEQAKAALDNAKGRDPGLVRTRRRIRCFLRPIPWSSALT